MTRLLKGTVSTTLFKPNKVPKTVGEARECLERFSFKKLESTDIRDESSGWVDAILCFDNENFSSLMHDRFFVFALRTDKYSFSASQLRPYVEEAEFVFKKENNLEYIAAQQKKEIKEQVIKKLKSNSFPKTTVIEVAWDMESRLVYFFSQSGQVIAKFTDIFEKTFETTLENVYIFDSLKKMGTVEKVEPVFAKIWSVK
ncbi:MAG TPA: recombination-associated protein RdgC [bacterium]|nr:recombination-associated protein RdgC [bacterium]HPS28698.1 recombination-associated protein RdgC [bacterium]